MCGIVGLLIKDPALEGSLGVLLMPMIEALAERGPDSCGIAVYSSMDGEAAGAGVRPRLRLSLGSEVDVDWPSLGTAMAEEFGPSLSVRTFPSGAWVELPAEEASAVTHFMADRCPDSRILARGRTMTVVKDTGRPEETCRRHGLLDWQGYMGIAHTRMATESAVTLLHSHPFSPADDLCVVHNGSFSNYAGVRRWLMRQGLKFDSDNDSEVAARLLAARLEAGDDLKEATRCIMKELDGFFTLVITTGEGMSVVRDAFACKPAVVAETPAYVAVASEYRALAHLPGIDAAAVYEPYPEEVYTWTR